MKKRNRKTVYWIIGAVLAVLLLAAFARGGTPKSGNRPGAPKIDVGAEQLPIGAVTGAGTTIDLAAIPDYYGVPVIPVNGNRPGFVPEAYETEPFESYAELDRLGRAGAAFACIGKELLPTEARQPIGMIRPSGWQTVRYDELIEDKYLYNRCHLIAFELTGENDNERNLITGTRYLNVTGMLPLENRVRYYIEDTGDRVLYRVTPVYDGTDLVAKGILIEAASVSDRGAGLSFCVFCYNIQPGVTIAYRDGSSRAATEGELTYPLVPAYVLNLATGKYHAPDCSYAAEIAAANRSDCFAAKEELDAYGFTACGVCKP